MYMETVCGESYPHKTTFSNTILGPYKDAYCTIFMVSAYNLQLCTYVYTMGTDCAKQVSPYNQARRKLYKSMCVWGGRPKCLNLKYIAHNSYH